MAKQLTPTELDLLEQVAYWQRTAEQRLHYCQKAWRLQRKWRRLGDDEGSLRRRIYEAEHIQHQWKQRYEECRLERDDAYRRLPRLTPAQEADFLAWPDPVPAAESVKP